jgi:selenide,water dikinase
VLRQLTPQTHPDLLVGTATGDDAAVWRLDEERALIFTADFITPVVDDARTWGRIAATNAISDVYAMGGRPLMALNLVGWNTDELDTELLGEVLEGAIDVARHDGFLVVGGHTTDDPEPKFGLAVLGEVHPDRLLTNADLKPGQSLVLTKPLGIGVISTAVKRGDAASSVVEAAVASMTRSNADAARVALDVGATGATDVTGFGLLGHLGRMALESGVDVTLDSASVPLIEGARLLAEDGVVPGGTRRNLAWIDDRLDRGAASEATVLLLADAQTSGGLVFGVDPAHADAAVLALRSENHDAAIVGTTVEGSGQLAIR